MNWAMLLQLFDMILCIDTSHKGKYSGEKL